MNYTYHRWYICCFFFLIYHASDYAVDLFGKSFLHPRSQNTDRARHIAGMKRLWYHHPKPTISITPSYGHSFRPYRIAEYFFSTPCLSITGSAVENRQPDQLLADHFGLSPAFQSDIELRPSITTGLIDFHFYTTYGRYYIQIHTPYVWVRNKIEIAEKIINNGSDTPFPARYFSDQAVFSPAQSFTQSVRTGVTVGDLSEPLQWGKIGCPPSQHRFADILMIVGWNYCIQQRCHLALQALLSVPTGNRPNGRYLFEPIIGNGHHLEVGAGISGHIILWEKDLEQTLGLYAELNATHLFATTQHRSFDFCQQGFGSRYMLLKEFNEDNIYTKKLVPAINVITLPCCASNSIQFEFVCMAGYQYNQWDVDLGYSAWLRSKDVLQLKYDCIDNFDNRFGFKGVQNVRTPLLEVDNTTQSNATIVGTETPIADVPSPHLLTLTDINIKSAANPQSFTHKIFGHINYFGKTCYCVNPFIGIGGEIEFESIRHRPYTEPNKNCISQWSIWLKIGVSFI